MSDVVVDEKKRLWKDPSVMNIFNRIDGGEYFELLIEVENVPGAIAKISEAISSFNANIWSGFHAVVPEFGGAWAFFLQVPPSASFEDLLQKLRGLKEVGKVQFTKLKSIDYFDEFFFPLVMGDERTMIFTKTAFSRLKSHLLQLLGTGGESILFNEGVTVGGSIYEGIPQALQTVDEKLEFIKDLIRATGWGLIEYKDLNVPRREGEIRVRENVEADEKLGVRCHFFRGSLTEILRRVFAEKSLSLMETECMGLGAPYCVFKLV